ncbi:MAG: hypothetical protein DHS20C03_09060 [Minwuia thermotolerans]|nr:MAG: hypothetical protein DHS20C03_09060 [Minwuia thermotolerans]
MRLEALKSDPQAFSDHFDVVKGMSDEDWCVNMKRQSQNGSSLIFAEENGVLVGMSGGRQYQFPDFSHNYSLQSLFVSPHQRRRGFGKRLLRAHIEFALKKNPGIANFLCEIYSSQVESINLHIDFGFIVVGRIVEFRKAKSQKSDLIYMQLRSKTLKL